MSHQTHTAMRIFYPSLLLTLLACLALSACDNAEPELLGAEVAPLIDPDTYFASAASGDDLRSDPDVQELFAIYDELMTAALQHTTPGELKAAFQQANITGDTSELDAIFGLSDAEIDALNTRRTEAHQRLVARYPDLETMAEGATCNPTSPANVSGFQAFYAELYDGDASTRPPPDCQWVALAVGVAACAATSPTVILYAMCVFVMNCSFCENMGGCG